MGLEIGTQMRTECDNLAVLVQRRKTAIVISDESESIFREVPRKGGCLTCTEEEMLQCTKMSTLILLNIFSFFTFLFIRVKEGMK